MTESIFVVTFIWSDTLEFEWDEAKSRANLRRRGFSFEIVADVDWDFAVLFDVQSVNFEEREVWIAPANDLLVVIVQSDRMGVRRIISVREATQPERRIWRKAL